MRPDIKIALLQNEAGIGFVSARYSPSRLIDFAPLRLNFGETFAVFVPFTFKNNFFGSKPGKNSQLLHSQQKQTRNEPGMKPEYPGMKAENCGILPELAGKTWNEIGIPSCSPTRLHPFRRYTGAIPMGKLTSICLLLTAFFGARANELPNATDVLKRVQARMELNCADSPTNRFHYYRTNVIDELDSNNKLKKRTVKLYEVQQLRGLPQSKLLVIDGKPLSAAEQRWRIAEEQRLQRTLTQGKSPDYSKPKPWLTDDILERFTFTVTGRTNRMQRSVLMLEFKPRADAPNRNMADRVVNKISGALWVDESEAEIVRLDLKMNEPVKFWGGILGQLDRFEWTLLRQRSRLGVWFNERSDGMVQIRKLFTSTRFKISEESFNFRRS